jgi:hypothetical protein
MRKICTCCKEEKELSAFGQDKHRADGFNRRCKKCSNAAALRWHKADTARDAANNKCWRERNKERIASRAKLYREANRDTTRARIKIWESKNPEKVAEKTKRWRKANPGRYVLGIKRWYQNNPGKNTEKVAKRRASKLNATPAWANRDLISEIYISAKEKEVITGIKQHVDHAVPLQSSIVCGLHVENNLQVIPALENMSKHNTHWPDMP